MFLVSDFDNGVANKLKKLPSLLTGREAGFSGSLGAELLLALITPVEISGGGCVLLSAAFGVSGGNVGVALLFHCVLNDRISPDAEKGLTGPLL